MNYRSLADLAETIRTNVHHVPRDIDLVVGIPRSGVLAASIIGLTLNLGVISLTSWLEGQRVASGQYRRLRRQVPETDGGVPRVLLVDDSILTGRALAEARTALAAAGRDQNVVTCAVYADPDAAAQVDLAFELVPMPRGFEWNLMHRRALAHYCVDIDGVLCLDPTPSQNDDGPAYLDFLRNVPPLVLPSYPVGHLVTSRLEKYRPETESWLATHGVEYTALHMLDLPDAATRRRLRCHASFKAGVYQSLPHSNLFVESEAGQAGQIAHLSGKPVLSFSTQQMYEAGYSYTTVKANGRSLASRLVRAASRLGKMALGQQRV